MMKNQGVRPFKLKTVQSLRLHDDAIRAEFCGTLLITIQDLEFLKKVIWTDQAKFSKGIFIRKNLRYWVTENPRVIREGRLEKTYCERFLHFKGVCLHIYERI